MSEISQRYARLSQAFADKIAAVPDDKWSARSPCSDWTALDVAKHVISTQGMFLKFVGQEMGALPAADEDPLGAWNAARGRIQAGLDDPKVAATEFDGMFGRSRFDDAVGKFLCMDLVVHGWDLARAAGLDESISSGDLANVRAEAEAFGDKMRAPQAFGPAIDPPASADEQTKVLAFLGREA
ncbi:MAG TPA: TIGR03086 family metal-binding protein [Acidimicrobiia bacterium]|nr:TIGR03086 family metal-binding protein [Acidimicrobiia bacterium]